MKKISYNSPVVLTYVIICFIMMFLNYITVGWVNHHLVSSGTSLLNPATYLRFILYIFGHADFSHFSGNIILILLVGPIVEERYGSKNLIIMIFSTAALTGILNSLLFHTGILGASGIVFFLVIISAFTNIKDKAIPLTLILVVACYLGQEVVNGLFSRDNISQFAHIFGGIMGIVWGIYYSKKK